MQIKTSLDWNQVSGQLCKQLNALPYNNDLLKMYKNMEGMIGSLSKLEVEARRTNKPYLVEEKIAEINSAIDRLEKWLLMASLMK